jgi:hypothetical protein
VRSPYVAAALVPLLLIACSGAEQTRSGSGPESTPIETPEPATSAPPGAPKTPKGSENTLIETPDYTGVIFTESRASEFGFLFDEASTSYWEPSIDDVSSAEECIRRFLTSAQQDPTLAPYQRENAAAVLENLEQYRRQYVGIVVDGEKRIWVNSFVREDSTPDWTHAPVYVLDGGKDYWEIEYVPLEDSCINFHVHGEA